MRNQMNGGQEADKNQRGRQLPELLNINNRYYDHMLCHVDAVSFFFKINKKGNIL